MPVLDLFPKTGRREIILVGKQNKNRKTQQRETQRNHSRDLSVLDLLPALCRLTAWLTITFGTSPAWRQTELGLPPRCSWDLEPTPRPL